MDTNKNARIKKSMHDITSTTVLYKPPIDTRADIDIKVKADQINTMEYLIMENIQIFYH